MNTNIVHDRLDVGVFDVGEACRLTVFVGRTEREVAALHSVD